MNQTARNIITSPANELASPRSVTEEQIKNITSVIGADMEMHGKYVGKKANGGICIEGQYQGSITFPAGGVVRIARDAVVNETTLEADVVLIEGSFTGTVHARRLLEVLPCASIEGQIHYADLDMHRGAKVKAELFTLEPIAEDEAPSGSIISTTAGASKVLASPFVPAAERSLPVIRPTAVAPVAKDDAPASSDAVPLGVIARV